MSLLKKASIITTPTAYAEDYLYSIKPAIPFGEELVINGNFHNNVDSWSNGNSGVNTWVNGHLVCTGDGGSYAAAKQVIPAVENRKYIVTAQIARVSGSFQVGIEVNDGNGSGWNVIGSKTTSSEFVTVSEVITTNTGTTQLDLRATIFNTTVDNTNSLKLDNVSVKLLTDADFDFDRNSTGTRVNEDYLIEDVPYNLATYSEDFSDSAYIKFQASIAETTIQSPISGSYVESISNTNTGTTYSFISQNLLEPDRESNLTLSVYAKKGTYNRLGISSRASGNTFGALFDLDSGTVVDTSNGSAQILGSSIQSAGNDFYLCSVTLEKATQFNIHPVPNNISNAALLIGSLSYTETGNVNIFGAQAVKGTNLKPYLKTTDRLDIPRIDYTNGEPSILLEPSRTNEVTYSQDFTQSYWSKNNVTVTSNQAISPEGIQNADKLIIDNGTVSINGGLYKSRSSTQNQDVSFSIFAKAGEFRYGTIAYGSTNANGFHFDLEDGVILSTFTNTSSYTNIGYEMIPYPNGWYRLVVSTTELQQGVGRFIGIRPHNTIPTATNNNYNSTGNGTSGIFVYGGQIEVGSYPTSLIHTSGSAVTRSADYVSNAGNSDLISSTEGVLYGELSKPQLDNDAHLLIALINNGATTDQNTVTIGFDSDDDFFIRIKSSGSDILKYNSATSYPNQFYKIAVKYKSGDSSMYIDGKQVASSTNTFTFVNTLNEINFNFDNNNGLPFYGNCKSIMVFKEALSDTELECLTGYNNHELYMNYYNRLSYLGLVEEYNVESDINNYIL